MGPTAGILMFSLVLSLNLCSVTANPVHLSCKLKEMLNHLHHNLKSLNSTLNLTHVHPSGDVIDYHVFDKSPTCGLIYMEREFIKIQDYWEKIFGIVEEFKDIVPKLKLNIIPCARHILGKCDQHPPREHELPHSNYKVKQWTRKFLDSYDKFLHRLLVNLKNKKK